MNHDQRETVAKDEQAISATSTGYNKDESMLAAPKVGKAKSCRRNMQELINLQRQNKVLLLISQGYSQVQVANKLKMSQPTVSRIWNENMKNCCKTRQDYNNLIISRAIKKMNESDMIRTEIWRITGDKKIDVKVKLNALKILMQYDDNRIHDSALSKLANMRSNEWGLDIRDP